MLIEVNAAIATAQRQGRKPVMLRVPDSFNDAVRQMFSGGGLFRSENMTAHTYYGLAIDYVTHSPHVLTEDGTMIPIAAPGRP